MDVITGGFQSNISVHQVLSQLSNVSQPTKDVSGRPLQIYGGDLVIAVDILVRIAEYNANQGNVSSNGDVKNFAQVASNLLEKTNSKTWRELDKAGKGRSQMLVKAMDDYGLGVAATFNDSTKSKVVSTKNLMMRMDRVDHDSLLTGLNITDNQSSIYLPSQAFSSFSDSRVVTLFYLTLSDVLSLSKESDDKDGQALQPDNTIVSSTIHPRPPDIINQPVKIVLQNKKMSNFSDVIPRVKCVFWRPEEESARWNTSGCRLVSAESTTTTCECNHLTIFAALMDPYGLTARKGHKEALEIISIVGCSISLLAVLITMAVTLLFWRVLKSPRVVCSAIAVSSALVIFEGLAREKVGCPVVAAFLHYFLLALFSWMLCEGVLHYILLVQILGGDVVDKVKYFYIFGWGFPAIVVVISLAVTQANGYGSAAACWLDVKSGLIWAFIAPALLVILINAVVFMMVMRQLIGVKYMQDKTQIEKMKAGVKASAVLLPLLGITWLFGLLSFNSVTIAFKYIFAIFNSLQGLVIFIFHCAFNKQIRDAIKRRRERSRIYSIRARVCRSVNHPPTVQEKHSNTVQTDDCEVMDIVASDNLLRMDSKDKPPPTLTYTFRRDF